jgi:hypothetical protein
MVRLAATRAEGSPTRDSKPILVAENKHGLAALSFVTFDSQWVLHAIIEDLVVSPTQRSEGGKAVIDWIANEARVRDIKRLMLESGLTNERAHEFFEEREGFVACSKVMMRQL